MEEKADLNGEVFISAWINELLSPLSRGNGIVFDGGEPEGDEVGGYVQDVSYLNPSEDKKSSSRRVVLRPSQAADPGSKDVMVRIEYKGSKKVKVGDLVWKTKDAEVDARMRASYTLPERDKRKNPISVAVSGRFGEPLTIELTDEAECCRCSASSSSMLQLASKRSLTRAEIEDTIGSLGANALDVSSINTSRLDFEAGLFLPLSELKATRRRAVELFMGLKMKHGRDQGLAKAPVVPNLLSTILATPLPLHVKSRQGEGIELRLLCRTRSQVEAACEVPWLKEVIVDFLEVQGLKEAVSYAKQCGKRVVVSTPRILKPDEERLWLFYLLLGADALLIRSLGFLEKMIELGGAGAIASVGGGVKVPELEGDFSLNASNVIAADMLLTRGISRLALTHDLNVSQLCDLSRSLGPRSRMLEAIIHTHLPIFHTEHCVFCRFLSSGNSYKDCGHPCETQRLHLRDASGSDHLVLADQGCRNTVFNAQAQSGLYSIDKMMSSGFGSFRIELVDEPADMVAPLLEAYRDAAGLGGGGGGVARTSPTEIWRWLSTIPDANGRAMGVGPGSLSTQPSGINKALKTTAAVKKSSGGQPHRRVD